jgi:hypothetical protein
MLAMMLTMMLAMSFVTTMGYDRITYGIIANNSLDGKKNVHNNT